MANEVKTQLQKDMTDQVLGRINQLKEIDALVLPGDYVPGNALKAAWLMLPTVLDKDKNRAIDVCTPESIQNALFDMCVRGLNPSKAQGYFIVSAKELRWQNSYFGNQALAKRVGGLKRIKGTIIYEKDIFTYEIDPETARVKVIEHKQELENIDIKKIRGAYATYELVDGTKEVVPMTIDQIKESWNMGPMKGQSPAHLKFTDEMAKKSVINRACKYLINTSSDSALMESQDPNSNEELVANANTIDISFQEVETKAHEPAQDVQKSEPVTATEQKPVQKAAPKEAPAENQATQASAPQQTSGPGF